MSIRYDGKVAIVTGAGQGLGRCHAVELAKRGAKVVINDLGGAKDGTGGSSEAARSVVAEIEALGGEAIANGANVADYGEVEAMVQQAMEQIGVEIEAALGAVPPRVGEPGRHGPTVLEESAEPRARAKYAGGGEG